MRPPSKLKRWQAPDELSRWVDAARDVAEYRQRLAVWIVHLGGHNAHEVAALLKVSKQSVWQWIGRYNSHGPNALRHRGRGGRRRAHAPPVEEWTVGGFVAPSPEAEDALRTRIYAVRHAMGLPVSSAYLYRKRDLPVARPQTYSTGYVTVKTPN